jgi:hypothetical protein
VSWRLKSKKITVLTSKQRNSAAEKEIPHNRFVRQKKGKNIRHTDSIHLGGFPFVIQAILASLLESSPLFIIWLVGIILAAVRWQKHPRLSLLVVIVFLLFLVSHIITTIVGIALPVLAYQTHMSFTTVGIINLALSLVFNIPLWCLLLWTIFGWRSPATTTGPVLFAQPPFQPQQPQSGQPPFPPDAAPPQNRMA